jgi:hypothetical protein
VIGVCFPLGYVDLIVSKILLSCLSSKSLSGLDGREESRHLNYGKDIYIPIKNTNKSAL